MMTKFERQEFIKRGYRTGGMGVHLTLTRKDVPRGESHLGICERQRYEIFKAQHGENTTTLIDAVERYCFPPLAPEHVPPPPGNPDPEDSVPPPPRESVPVAGADEDPGMQEMWEDADPT